MARSCTIEVENHFGPIVGTACYGGLDFTLYFEEAFLSIFPAATVILAAVLRCLVVRSLSVKVRGGWLYPVKLLCLALYSISQLLLFAFWVKSGTPTTDLTLAATLLRFLATLFCGYLSLLEHYRAVRPSKILNLYFLLSLLFDIPQARTIWIVQGLHTVAGIFVAGMAVKALVLILEIWEKKRLAKPMYATPAPEDWTGVINRSLFWWFNPLLIRGARNALSMGDLFHLEDCMIPDPEGKHRLALLWEHCENKEKSGAMIGPLAKAFKWDILAGIIPRLSQTGFTFAQPFLVQAATKLFADNEQPYAKSKGILLLGAYALVYSGIAVSTATAQHKTYRLITMMRGALVGMIFDKSTTINAHLNDDSAALTLMSTDIERITSCGRYLHDTWASLIEIAISLYLLYNQLSTAGVAPIIIAFACTVVAMKIAMVAGERQNLWIEAIQKRVSVTAEMLGSMKGVKISGLKDLLHNKIQGLREDEILASLKFRTLLICVVALSNFNTLITPVVTFTIYAMGSRDGKAGYLDSERALTCLTLFNLFSVFIGALVESISDTAMALECVDRIRDYLAKDPHEDLREVVRSPERLDDKSPCIEAINVDIGWTGGEAPVLHGLFYRIERSTLTMIVGAVGCGKTTLVKAMLGEVNCMTGKMRVNCDRMAYCGQEAWLTNGTVQENILGGAAYDPQWYSTVIAACGLEKDFTELGNGDQTAVGSKGVSLSGGQKQRLALARALYSGVETILMDDALSGLDPVTDEHIFTHVLGPRGLARTQGLTVIMVTHAVHRLPYADHIIALKADGTILVQGTFEDCCKKLDHIQGFAIAKPPAIQMKSEMPKAVEKASPPYSKEAISDARKTSDLQTYIYYLTTVPWYNWLVYFGFMAVFVFFQAFPSVWVTWWARDNDERPNKNLSMRIGVYWLFGVLGGCFLLATAWFYMLKIVAKTASVIHSRLLRTVLNAPMAFFATTDSGITINRFSQDLELIDMELPLAVLQTCLALFLCVAQLIIIAVSAKYITATIPLCIFVYCIIGTFYIRTSRQLRIMDIEAKSPLFSNFMELLNGLVTIRAFNWEEQYKVRNRALLAESQRPFYLLYTVQRWLSLVLDMTVTGFVVVLMGIAVGTMQSTDASFLGLALVNVVSLSASVKALITDWTVLETSLGAVTRVKHFAETTESEEAAEERDLPPDDWTGGGTIEYRNVSAFYRDPSAPVLKNVSFYVRKGEKVAICGRSGSGKSTLVSALFRMIELCDGCIVVDGVDIATLPRQEIRSAIIGLPQDPLLLEDSTVRENVDPFDYSPDEAVINTLKRVGLWEIIEGKGGLDTVASGELFSHGQRQLLCMAKAMLRHGNIIVFDEATSGVDPDTDEMMQELIRSCFADYTVVTVTHRLDTIIDYDRVLVMDNGVLLESDQPRELLARPSIFRELYKSSRGWEEYERQERAEAEARERERLEKEQEQRVEAEQIRDQLRGRSKRLSYIDTDVVSEKDEPETFNAIREHWSAVNQLFENIIPRAVPRNRSRSRDSADRESKRYSNPEPTTPGGAVSGRDRRSLTGLAARGRFYGDGHI
ncbi:ABC transporter [Aspergillus saccharolyticus JOP 1030-1]|uniref:ABC transporter n=1 Tax=Aspergillus saccharolyticus JOP 1030-1 TaxID=1450539 RepID=A0A318ZG26_9EURO|nr:ABC transporter [Aspergillus saccharolyticus JOP 1030-1]PYH46501.1 ABC transporter [Aspergillus saccharolyticus JOP 1030-1]